MKNVCHLLLFLLLVIFISNCAPKEKFEGNFTQNIKSAYFQKNIVDTDTITSFYVSFDQPISKEIILRKVYFQNQVANFTPLSATSFKATFAAKYNNSDLIFDSKTNNEYGNKAPIISKTKYKLKADEALIEYTRNGSDFLYKINKVSEKLIIVAPSMIKPKK